MRRGSMIRLRYVAAIMIVMGLYLANDDVQAVAAAPAAASATGAYGWCSDDCGPSVSCETQCYSVCDQCSPYLTTCGEYSGEPWNGLGQCIGECGDFYCNEYNNEDPDTCYQDCGECGDSICTSGYEDAAHCYQDCGYCGDGICTYAEVCGESGECETDCNSCDDMGDECDPAFEECGFPGDICNPRHYCVEAGYRSCGSDPHGCCENEIWFEVDCDWVYVHEGQAAGEACENDYCLPGYGCGVCVPSGPMAPKR